MGRCCRHFRALTKKNFINSKRTPVCTILELILGPCLLILLIWLRTKIPIQETDLVGLEQYKHPLYPALKYGGKARKTWSVDFDYTNDQQAAFMEAYDYAPRPPVPGEI